MQLDEGLGPSYAAYSLRIHTSMNYAEKLHRNLHVFYTANKWICHHITGANSLMLKINASLEDSDNISSTVISSKQTSGHLPHERSLLADPNVIGLISVKVLLLIFIIIMYWF